MDPNSEGILYKLFKVLYVPLLMKSVVRAAVMVVFFGWVCASVAVIPHIEVGLDQELSMSEDSYVFKYFKVIIHLQFIYEEIWLKRNWDDCCSQKLSMCRVRLISPHCLCVCFFHEFFDLGSVLSNSP